MKGMSPGGGIRRVEVRTAGGGAYPVVVGSGALADLPDLVRDHAPAHRYAIISDETVAELYGARVRELLRKGGFRADLLSFPPGEREKSRGRWADLTDRLLALGMGRDGCVVALGGGVTGDLAGFVAATFLRGVPVVQIPTSLVAMIDASVGGKTGLDLSTGKNLVGAFHPPRLVVVDPTLAATLAPAERSQGLAEALKHGAILDRPYALGLAAEAEALLEGDAEATTRAVLRSVELKADVVSRDEREEGYRQILNFGHTLGHALEVLSEYRLPHGSAVARGMVLEAGLGEALGVTEPGTAEALEDAAERLGHRRGRRAATDVRALVAAASTDKKARRGEVRYVLLRRLGEVEPGDGWSHPVSRERVTEILGGLASEAV
jgi:3-dehydroquinate synthase